MKIISIDSLSKIIQVHGLDRFLSDLIRYLREDFNEWQTFDKSPRYAVYAPEGVVELMPINNKTHFFYKYVNGHPVNPSRGKLTVFALGQMASLEDGYPTILTEMTVLTALRTAATAALAADVMARKDSQTLAVIGTGSQSEFQVLAHKLIRPIREVKYFDLDPKACEKFHHNLQNSALTLTQCSSVEEAVSGSDILIVCTACKKHADVILNAWVKPGMHINGLGGDSPGKTELERSILFRGKVVVEYKEQSMVEGEIQRLSPEELSKVLHGELWEIIQGKKPGRENPDEVTIFDCVGFALEDYSVVRLVKDLSEQYQIGEDFHLIPELKDPKNLFSILNIRGSS